MMTLGEWAKSRFRPCCGTCRRPALNLEDKRCLACGAPWSGAEASAEEAAFRVQLSLIDAIRGPTRGACEDCATVGPRVEVPWVGITGTNEGKSVCLGCAGPYVIDEKSPTHSLEEGYVGLVVKLARGRAPHAVAGWLFGVAVTYMILHDRVGRESIERVLTVTLDETFGALERKTS